MSSCSFTMQQVLVAFFLFSSSLLFVNGSNFNEPHSHQGVVTPFERGDPKVKLDKKALTILTSGKPYQTQIQSGTAGRGMVVQDIDAPTDVVWGRILDYDNYANMVPKTVESKNYKVIDHKPTKANPLEQTIYTRMKVGFPMLKLEFFIKHLYFPSENSLTWTLDYDKSSDFNDSCGYWYVVPHPDKPDWTRVYYSVEVALFDWVPKFVVDFMSSKALTDATAWVKKYSELEWSKQAKNRVSSDGDTAGESGTASTGAAVKKKRTGLSFFSPKKRKEKEAEEAAAVAAAAAEVCEEDGDEEAKSVGEVLKRVGWTRVALVAIVCILGLYNASLAFDRFRDDGN